MAIRRVYGLEDKTQQAMDQIVRDLNDEIARINAGDLKGRKLTNAGMADQPFDLVTKTQLDALGGQVTALARSLKGLGRKTTPAITPTGDGLPPPNHPMDFSYFFTDNPPDGAYFGEYYDEVKSYTNGYWFGFEGDLEFNTRKLAAAAADGKFMTFEYEATYDPEGMEGVLAACENVGFDTIWPLVRRILFVDEPSISDAEIGRHLARAKDALRRYNLPDPPQGFGYSLTRKQIERGDHLNVPGVSFIGVEGYLDPPGSDTSSVNVEALNLWLDTAKRLVPNSKKMMFVIQAYARNGSPAAGTYAWPNFKTLADIQIPVYLKSYDDPRVTCITAFSYGRYSGTRDIDKNGAKLGEKHRLIGAAITGGDATPLGCNKQVTGGILAEVWVDVVDRCIGDNQVLLEYIGGVTFIKAGFENAFRDALIALFNEPGYNLRCRASTEAAEQVLLAKAGDDTFSELYAVYASDRRVRYTDNAYLATCRPSVF